MIGKNTIKKIVNFAIKKSKADELQITIQSEDSFLTRFANSTIHQNVMETNTRLTVTSGLGKKTGFSTTARWNKASIEITTFHYVNVVDPRTLVLTGMTRNGTFPIEDGQRSCPVNNLRFNQNIINLFKNIIAISAERQFVDSGNSYSSRFPIGSILPYIIVADFNFTGTTEF